MFTHLSFLLYRVVVLKFRLLHSNGTEIGESLLQLHWTTVRSGTSVSSSTGQFAWCSIFQNVPAATPWSNVSSCFASTERTSLKLPFWLKQFLNLGVHHLFRATGDCLCARFFSARYSGRYPTPPKRTEGWCVRLRGSLSEI